MCDRVPVDFVHFGQIKTADLPGFGTRPILGAVRRTLGSFGSILRSDGPWWDGGLGIILPGEEVLCGEVGSHRSLSPGPGVLPLWTQPQVAPTTCPVALAQLQVCVPVGVVLGAGLRADQGNDLSLGYRTGQG